MVEISRAKLRTNRCPGHCLLAGSTLRFAKAGGGAWEGMSLVSRVNTEHPSNGVIVLRHAPE